MSGQACCAQALRPGPQLEWNLSERHAGLRLLFKKLDGCPNELPSCALLDLKQSGILRDWQPAIRICGRFI
jgi:hypothetical protein